MTNLQAHYAKNAAGLAKMLAKAETTGKLVGGYTADQLRVLVADYRKLASEPARAAGASLADRRLLDLLRVPLSPFWGHLMSDHETTLTQLATCFKEGTPTHAACLAGADALRRGAAQLLVLKCAERACDADNMDAAVDYVREAIRQIAPTEPTR